MTSKFFTDVASTVLGILIAQALEGIAGEITKDDVLGGSEQARDDKGELGAHLLIQWITKDPSGH